MSFKVVNKINDYILKEGEVLLAFIGYRICSDDVLGNTFCNYHTNESVAFNKNQKRKYVLGNVYVFNYNAEKKTFSYQDTLGAIQPDNKWHNEIKNWSVEELAAIQKEKVLKASKLKHTENIKEDITLLRTKLRQYGDTNRKLLALYIYEQLLK